jgi:high-affinity nickel permease
VDHWRNTILFHNGLVAQMIQKMWWNSVNYVTGAWNVYTIRNFMNGLGFQTKRDRGNSTDSVAKAAVETRPKLN